MPKLDSEKRQSINERLALYTRIRESFKGKGYVTQHCALCNWASNGLTIEEAIKVSKLHDATHPETAQIEAAEINIDELRDLMHDHECIMALCSCKCGCREGPFCTLIFGSCCSVCSTRETRGDNEHGEKVENKTAREGEYP